jgi:peptide/histidine transporter 3/4
MHNSTSINVYISYIFMLRISFSFIFSIFIDCTGVNPMDEEMCLVDSGTTNSILREIKYFQTLTKSKGNVLTIAGRDAVIAGSGRAIITLPMGTTITIEDALLYPDSTRTLLSYRDIRKNGYHIETHHQNNEEFLLITKDNGYGRDTLERIPSTSSGLYYSYIKPVQHVAYKVIFQNVNAFQTWHDRLGHPGIGMMRKITSNSVGHSLTNAKFPQSSDYTCTACATGKLILRPSSLKIKVEPLNFLERIQGDICGPINPLSGPFRYFMVLIDASTRWSHVSLLSTRNHAFAKIIAQVIKLKVQHPEHQIKSIRMDNAAEFSSRAFNDYCMALGIQVQHSVPYVHTQNGLAESLIKRIKLIARPLLQNCNLPTSCWGHAVLHAAELIQLRPTAYHATSPLQLVHGNPPSISHLRKFGCATYVPISPPKRTTMGPHRKLGIYVGYKSPSIIKYLEPTTGDLFTARYADCIFNEDHFPALGGDLPHHKQCQEINWDAPCIPNSDPRTSESELQVQKIINLQHIANNVPDAFTDYKGVTKSYNPARNVPERVEVPNKTTQLPSKRGRSTAISTDTASSKQRKRKTKSSDPVNAAQPHVEKHPVEVQPSHPTSTVHSITDAGTSEYPDATILGNDDASERVHEISINYAETGESFDRKTTIVDSYFSAMIAEILENDPDPKTMAECKTRSDWNQWKDAIQAEISSLTKRQVFSQVIPTPPQVFPVGFKWVFV